MLPDRAISPELAAGEVQIWVADIRDWLPEKKDRLQDLFNRDEQDRLERYKITSKQDQFLCSRGLLKLILSAYIDEDPHKIDLSTSATGKPFLPGQALNFNLSHSGNLLVLGFGCFDHLGVDIQEIYSISNIEILIDRYYSPEEKAFLTPLDRDHRLTQFFSIWTAKEAYLKALGKGFHASLKTFGTLPGDNGNRAYHLSGQDISETNKRWMIRELDIQPGYIGAVAVDGNLKDVMVLPLTPADM